MKKKTKKIFIITKSDSKIGSGHLQRQRVLSDFFLKKKYIVFFFFKSEGVYLKNRDNLKVFKTINKKIILEKIKKKKPDYIILDLHPNHLKKFYYLNEYKNIIIFLSNVKSPNLKFGDLIFLIGKNLYYKSLIIKKNKQKIVSGRNYIWLRNEFNIKKRIPIREREFDILVSNGLFDDAKLSLKIIDLLEHYDPKLKIAILTTSYFKHISEIKKKIVKTKHNYKIFMNNKKISNLMQKSKIAIINGGTTKYELLKCGTFIMTVTNNKIQNNYNRKLAELNLGFNFGIINKLKKQFFVSKIKYYLNNTKLVEKKSIKVFHFIDKNSKENVLKIIKSI